MVPMDSEKLSARTKQPGHDQTFARAEQEFLAAAKTCLDPARYKVVEKPQDLLKLFSAVLPSDRDLGVQPDASIQSLETGRRFFVEVKKQGPQGNAEERAYKHHTVQFYETLRQRFGYSYHPFVTVFCDSLSCHPRYTRKFSYLLEANQYFLWQDYDRDLLCDFLHKRCQDWLG
ncbi:MAG: MunI family type II restriction endonuclease [Acidimicrobiaceae bacterium]|nr:MunI family type II restriction endonuclease [Acidimicrobiaceae bacterium]MCY4280974.1 MunI family type II restriction endonuclease [Acidimicrobiaceae bacterium]MCY4295170.1 MunI family type II restriction endonuclease [Acidimicrobiaceae bacterium]